MCALSALQEECRKVWGARYRLENTVIWLGWVRHVNACKKWQVHTGFWSNSVQTAWRENLDTDRIILKMILKNITGWHEKDSSGSGQGPGPGTSEHSNEPPHSTKSRKFFQ